MKAVFWIVRRFGQPLKFAYIQLPVSELPSLPVRSEGRILSQRASRSDKQLTLEMPASLSFYGRNLTLINLFDNIFSCSQSLSQSSQAFAFC